MSEPSEPTCLANTKSSMDTIWNAIYRKENGETLIMDRNGKSWAKILTFYAIYYSFLGLLFWATITLYQGAMIPTPGNGNAPRLSTRLGQPGLAVHPFNGIDPLYKGAESGMVNVKLHPADLNEKVTQNYLSTMNTFLEKSGVSNIDLDQAIVNKQPIIGINLNKVINWQPLSQSGEVFDNTDFVKNSVTFDCSAVDNNGEPNTAATYDFEFINGKNYMLPDDFPFTGESDYQKPYVLLRLKNLVPNEKCRFMCQAFADNLTKRDESDKALNSNMAKVGTGFVQFSVEIVE